MIRKWISGLLCALLLTVAADAQMLTTGAGKKPGGGGGGGTTTFDTGSAVATLSGGNLTASIASNTIFAGVRSVASHSTGKYYNEFTINAVTSGLDNQRLGFVTSSHDLHNQFAGSTSVGYNLAGGQVIVNGGTAATIFTATAGDIIGMALDLTNNKIWYRKNGGNWNNSGTDNPATNTGGVSLTGTDAGPYYAAMSLELAGDNFTGNFGATAYSTAAPSGFGNW